MVYHYHYHLPLPNYKRYLLFTHSLPVIFEAQLLVYLEDHQSGDENPGVH